MLEMFIDEHVAGTLIDKANFSRTLGVCNRLYATYDFYLFTDFHEIMLEG
jgi:hypothetical protein